MSTYKVKTTGSKSITIIDSEQKVFVRVYPGFFLSLVPILGKDSLKWYRPDPKSDSLMEQCLEDSNLKSESEVECGITQSDLDKILKGSVKESFLVNRFDKIKEVLEELGLEKIIISMNSSSMRKIEKFGDIKGLAKTVKSTKWGEIKMLFDVSEKGARVSIYIESLANSDLENVDKNGGIFKTLKGVWDSLMGKIIDLIKESIGNTKDEREKLGLVKEANENAERYKGLEARKFKIAELEEKTGVNELSRVVIHREELIEMLDSEKANLKQAQADKENAKKALEESKLDLKNEENNFETVLKKSGDDIAEDAKSRIEEAKFNLFNAELQLQNVKLEEKYEDYANALSELEKAELKVKTAEEKFEAVIKDLKLYGRKDIKDAIEKVEQKRKNVLINKRLYHSKIVNVNEIIEFIEYLESELKYYWDEQACLEKELGPLSKKQIEGYNPHLVSELKKEIFEYNRKKRNLKHKRELELKRKLEQGVTLL